MWKLYTQVSVLQISCWFIRKHKANWSIQEKNLSNQEIPEKQWTQIGRRIHRGRQNKTKQTRLWSFKMVSLSFVSMDVLIPTILIRWLYSYQKNDIRKNILSAYYVPDILLFRLCTALFFTTLLGEVITIISILKMMKQRLI